MAVLLRYVAGLLVAGGVVVVIGCRQRQLRH